VEKRRSSTAVASVVVAAKLFEGDVEPCLSALAAQQRDDVEVVLAVDRPPTAGLSRLADQVIVQDGALVPELWTAGIRASSGRRVGLLSSSVVPAANWIDLLVAAALDGKPAASGGPIEPPLPGGSAADWTVLFCRYSRYLLPVPVPGPDVAADNASYQRSALDAVAETWHDGFWEPFVHRALRALGEEVVTNPTPVVNVAPGQSLSSLVRQRFRHGQQHARLQAEGQPRVTALLRAAAAPVVPFLLAARGAQAVWSRRRLRLRFVLTLPLLLWAHCWWATGEAFGYVDHAARRA
jgi:hypothetical protein